MSVMNAPTRTYTNGPAAHIDPGSGIRIEHGGKPLETLLAMNAQFRPPLHSDLATVEIVKQVADCPSAALAIAK